MEVPKPIRELGKFLAQNQSIQTPTWLKRKPNKPQPPESIKAGYASQKYHISEINIIKGIGSEINVITPGQLDHDHLFQTIAWNSKYGHDVGEFAGTMATYCTHMACACGRESIFGKRVRI